MRPVDGHGAGDAGSLGRTLAEALEKVRALEAERVEMRRRQEDQERANQEMAARQRALEAERLEMAARHQALEAERMEMAERIAALEHQLGLLKRHLFGSRSEKIDAQELAARIARAAKEAADAVAASRRPDDPPAEAEGEEAGATSAAPAGGDAVEQPGSDARPKTRRKARPHGRNRLPDHLQRLRVEHPLAPGQDTCPHCPDHPRLVRIGEDIREKLHRLPVQYVVHQHVYPKCVCTRCHQGVAMPPGPDHGLKAEASVVADVVVKKYAEHQPLYRQQEAFERVGISVRRQTLCGWVGWCAGQMEPVVRAMREHILRQPCILSDETWVRMQLATGLMQTGRLWAHGLPWAEVVFDFRTDKSHQGPEAWLGGTTGRFLQTDGGSSYGPVFRHLGLEQVACMAHIRRKIFEAREDAPAACDGLLALIQELYRVERRAKEEGLVGEALLGLRREKSRPVMENLGELIKIYAGMRPPKTPFGAAMAYALGQWEAMMRYLEVAGAEIDNNSTEHALRGVVMGRKNWLHVGREVGGHRAATLFTLMVSCRRLGVEPYGYLCDVLGRLGTHPQKDIWELTPRGWRDARARRDGPGPPPPSPSLTPVPQALPT